MTLRGFPVWLVRSQANSFKTNLLLPPLALWPAVCGRLGRVSEISNRPATGGDKGLLLRIYSQRGDLAGRLAATLNKLLKGRMRTP